MRNSLLIRCERCGHHSEIEATLGKDEELADRINFLEQKLFDIREENKELRNELSRLLR